MIAALNDTARTLHLIDVENLLGGTGFDSLDVIALENRYRERIEVGERDLFVIASSHATACASWFGWAASARRLLRSGPSGADLALVEAVERERVAERFANVVVGSGDRIFAEPAARLQNGGCNVTVAAQRPGTVSKRLAFAVRDVVYVGVELGEMAGEARLAA